MDERSMVPTQNPPAPPRALLWQFARDFGILAAVVVVYFLLRGQAPQRPDTAVAVMVRLVKVEQALHVFWEPDLQDLTTRGRLERGIATLVYAYLHFPALVMTGIWLWWRDRRRFVLVRNTLYVSMALGLVFFYALPAAPPRLLVQYGYDYGFSDTVFGGGHAAAYAQIPLFANDYAALPSFHFAWIVLVSVALWASSRSVWIRALAVLLTVAMTWSSAATANHLFIDMAIGGVVMVIAWLVAVLLRRWQDRRAQRPRPSTGR